MKGFVSGKFFQKMVTSTERHCSPALASEIIVLIYPFIVSRKSYKMLIDIEKNLKLESIKKEILDKERVLFV